MSHSNQDINEKEIMKCCGLIIKERGSENAQAFLAFLLKSLEGS